MTHWGILAELAKWIRTNWVLWWWTLGSPIHRSRLGEEEIRLLEAMALRNAQYIRGISPIDGRVMQALLIRARYITVVPSNPAKLVAGGSAEGMLEESFWSQNHPTEAGMKRLRKWRKETRQ